MTIAARNPERLEQAAAEIARETGIGVGWVSADLTQPAGRDAAIAACPHPDILINNADGPLPGDFRDWSHEDWVAALDAMMLGPIDMIRRVVDGMVERRFGRIVNIVSRSVKAPHAELGLSNGARSGLIGFVGGVARQTVRHNVTINNLLPGVFATDAQARHIRGMMDQFGQELRAGLGRARAFQSGGPLWRARRAGRFVRLCLFRPGRLPDRAEHPARRRWLSRSVLGLGPRSAARFPRRGGGPAEPDPRGPDWGGRAGGRSARWRQHCRFLGRIGADTVPRMMVRH